MAGLTRIQKNTTSVAETSNSGLGLVWLDDSAKEDPNAKEMLVSLFDNVFVFTDPQACLELVDSIETQIACLSILISGKYGQMLVRDRLQPLNQVKDIYVFCYDTVKHGRWAQTCDKVRCVFSDFTKILQCIQYDIQNIVEQSPPSDDEPQLQQDEFEKQHHRERYTDDNNLFDYLALNLLLQSPDDDGDEDFAIYCQTHSKTKQSEDDHVNEEAHAAAKEPAYKPDQTLQEWYQPDLFFTHINSNELSQLWLLRWFIRQFHRQLTNEHEKIVQNKTKFTVNHGTWLTFDELDAMKHRIGEIIIITELLLTYTNRQTALDSIRNNANNREHKVLFEINIDTTIRDTIPYAAIKEEEVLLWFGARYRLVKIEYIDDQDVYWSIGLNLFPTLDSKPSIQTLYTYYFKELTNLNNIHHTFGRILMLKGAYSQAEKWLQTGNHYQELAELALRQSHYEQAAQYLEHLSEDSDEANLLRAYLHISTLNNNFSKARSILLKIFSESVDKLIRARANIALGFINLILTQEIDQALEYFTLGSDVLRKILPDIHPDIAKSFIGIGYTYFSQHNIIDAKKYFHMSFAIQKQCLTYNHPDFAKTRNGLAHCLSIEKQTIKQALNECDYALRILLEAFQQEQEHHPQVVATRHDIEKLRKGKELRPRNTLLDYI